MKKTIQNENGILRFQPFRRALWLLPIVLGCVFACLVVAVRASMIGNATDAVVLLMLAVPLPLITYHLIIGGKITFALDRDGMEITGGDSRYARSISWKEFSYVHYVTDIKGGLIVIISRDPVDEKEAKRIAHTKSMLGRLRAPSSVAFGMLSGTEDAEEIKRFFSSHVEHIIDYAGCNLQ